MRVPAPKIAPIEWRRLALVRYADRRFTGYFIGQVSHGVELLVVIGRTQCNNRACGNIITGDTVVSHNRAIGSDVLAAERDGLRSRGNTATYEVVARIGICRLRRGEYREKLY